MKNNSEIFQKLLKNYKTDATKTRFTKKYVLKNPTAENVLNAIEKIKKSGSDFKNLDLIARVILGKFKTCPICNKIHNTRNETCSHECSVKWNKIKCLKKYGVENISQLTEIKNKVKQTNLEKFGSACSLHSPEISKRVKETFIQKYGVDCPLKSNEVIEKRAFTVQKRYGVSNVFQSEKIKEKIKCSNVKRYGTENPFQSETIKEKIRQTNFKKYGVYQYVKSDVFIKTRQECLLNDLKQISNVKNLENFNVETIKSFIVSENGVNYFDNVKCSEYFNISRALILRVKNAFQIKEQNLCFDDLRSFEETKLFNWIPCNNKISNDRKVIAPLELDIVLPDYKLAIEYNGVYWHSDFYKDQNYHLEKTLKCQDQGYQLFHIFESDDIDIWKSMIYNKLNLSDKIYARKCSIKEIPNKDAKIFCLQNHLQGACNAKINLGLFYNDTLVEVMTFGKPRYNKHYEYELLRLCSLKYHSIIGGATKLWKFFLQKYCPKSVISYANRRFSNGNIYNTLGFKFLNETKPNYWYVKDAEMYSRLRFQKHKLRKMFENKELKMYNDNMSECEIMQMNDYLRIYDCGNLVYFWE